MKSLLEGLRLAFTYGSSRKVDAFIKEYLTAAEKAAIILTAEGNVCFSMGDVCTPGEVDNLRKEVLRHVA